MQLWKITNVNDSGKILPSKDIWAEDPPVEEFTIQCTMVGDMRRLDDVETDEISLEVYECNCGFHIGLDATFLDQMEEITINCPSCKEDINTSQIPF